MFVRSVDCRVVAVPLPVYLSSKTYFRFLPLSFLSFLVDLEVAALSRYEKFQMAKTLSYNARAVGIT